MVITDIISKINKFFVDFEKFILLSSFSWFFVILFGFLAFFKLCNDKTFKYKKGLMNFIGFPVIKQKIPFEKIQMGF